MKFSNYSSVYSYNITFCKTNSLILKYDFICAYNFCILVYCKTNRQKTPNLSCILSVIICQNIKIQSLPITMVVTQVTSFSLIFLFSVSRYFSSTFSLKPIFAIIVFVEDSQNKS